MKKISLFIAAFGMMLALTSCFESVETPIEGTDLVTYTAKNTSRIGIKKAGAEEPITPPCYLQVNNRYGYLVAQKATGSNQTVLWDVLDSEGKSVTGESYERVTYAKEYFILYKGTDEYFLKNGASEAIGPKEDFVVKDGFVFTKSNGKWGIDGIFDEKYEEIVVLCQENSENRWFLVKASLEDQPTLLDSKGEVIKSPLPAKTLKKLEAKYSSEKPWSWISLSIRKISNMKGVI